MKGSKVYECKSMCKLLCDCCHNTKNRVIEKMCECDKMKCKILADFLQCLMVLEGLCNYICIVSCEHETLSSTILSELKQKCIKLLSCIEKLIDNFDKTDCVYLKCSELKKMCNDCKNIKSGKSKKSRKKR